MRKYGVGYWMLLFDGKIATPPQIALPLYYSLQKDKNNIS